MVLAFKVAAPEPPVLAPLIVNSPTPTLKVSMLKLAAFAPLALMDKAAFVADSPLKVMVVLVPITSIAPVVTASMLLPPEFFVIKIFCTLSVE